MGPEHRKRTLGQNLRQLGGDLFHVGWKSVAGTVILQKTPSLTGDAVATTSLGCS